MSGLTGSELRWRRREMGCSARGHAPPAGLSIADAWPPRSSRAGRRMTEFFLRMLLVVYLAW